ncbi:sister chromatid cohesion 1 protein 2 [Senna tora]|uniref:Sister chromatid cohesion 1 protein 2 n=1 Tax=Senna tora TaxID=362788 RepID=A0A834X9Q4_9FABA|nr:sister chromatid cohesion 1 protein 2 [Senna tora]
MGKFIRRIYYQSDRFEWFQGTFSPEEALVEQPRDVHQSHLMDIDLEITELITPMNEDFQDCTFSPEEQMQLDTDANHEERDLQMIMASIQEGQSYQEESTENDNTYVEEDMLEAHSTEGTNEESQNQNQNQNQNLQEGVYIEGGRAFVPVESIFIDLTSLPHVASIPRPNPGDTTPEFMVIPTPAPTEGASLSRRRKLVYDDSTKLPDEVFKESVNDASDLIREWKRPITPLQASQASRISTLSKGFFYEPLLPSEKKMRIPASVEPLETSGNSNETESQATNSLELTETAPNTALQLSEIRSVDSLDNPNVGALSLYEALEGEHSLSKDESFNLMNEEDSNATETENSESCGAWTGQTRKVAMQLQKSFMSQRKQEEEEVVSFSQVCGEKPRKECARLFYEMLVMKTTNFVDLEQNDAYGDISVKKLPKLDQIL